MRKAVPTAKEKRVQKSEWKIGDEGVTQEHNRLDYG